MRTLRSCDRICFAAVMMSCLVSGPLLAAELRLIDGEYRYYENGELVEHEVGLRALPDGPQSMMAAAGASSEPTEANPEAANSAMAGVQNTFEIEPDPDTDEQPGDPVCVVTAFDASVSTETTGSVSDASASAGGPGGTTGTAADEEEPTAMASTSAPPAPIEVFPLSGDPYLEMAFDSIHVGADDAVSNVGEHHFIAFIGDQIRREVGSYAASAAVYPDSASAQASSVMVTELMDNILDCELSLMTLVQAGDGSIQASPDQGSYQFGDEVELTAVPDAGWEFAGWNGDAGGMDNPLTLTISNNTEVFATFERQVSAVAVPVNAPLAILAMIGLLLLVAGRMFRRNTLGRD